MLARIDRAFARRKSAPELGPLGPELEPGVAWALAWASASSVARSRSAARKCGRAAARVERRWSSTQMHGANASSASSAAL
eukprot:2535451-Prymnesium_polylepis.1